jgi:hypothetical protein
MVLLVGHDQFAFDLWSVRITRGARDDTPGLPVAPEEISQAII